MKCIQCQLDNNLKDRTANFGHCSSCNHKFAFEPTTMTTVKITDPMFKRTIDELSANNTLFFTQKQLAYFLDKRLRRSNIDIFETLSSYIYSCVLLYISRDFVNHFLFPLGFCIFHYFAMQDFYKKSISKKLDRYQRKSSANNLRVLGLSTLLVGVFTSIVTTHSFSLFVVSILMGMGAIYFGNRSLRMNIVQEMLFQPNDIEDWLKRWQEVNGTVFILLAPPIKKKGTATLNQDVTAYSFDRLVVCQTAEVAQMLIANNFHFENNCAILSIGGYPEDIFDITMQMLRRNADLKVYLFHDCSPQGMSILHQLKTSDRWFKDSNVSIIDVGLTPNQVMTSKHLFIQTSTNSARIAKEILPSEWTGLSLDEITWLTKGNYVELESFTPQQLIQVLNQGIAGTLNIVGESDAYTTIGGYDGSIYAAESFG
jgi:hypothetical protein